MTTKTYSSAQSEHAGETMDIIIDDQKFVCTPWRMPPAVVVDIPGISVHGDSTSMWEAFEAAFSKEDAEAEGGVDKSEYLRFREFVRSPLRRIEAPMLGEILMDIYQEATGRPTTPSGS